MKWLGYMIIALLLFGSVVFAQSGGRYDTRGRDFNRRERLDDRPKLKDQIRPKRGQESPGRRGRWGAYYEGYYARENQEDPEEWLMYEGDLPADWVGPPLQLSPEQLNSNAVSINSTRQVFPNAATPLLWNGVVFVAARDLFEALSAPPVWDSTRRVAVAQMPGGPLVTLPLGYALMYLEDKPVPLPYPTVAVNDIMMVPLRAVAQTLGYQVEWSDADGSVWLYLPGAEAVPAGEAIP